MGLKEDLNFLYRQLDTLEKVAGTYDLGDSEGRTKLRERIARQSGNIRDKLRDRLPKEDIEALAKPLDNAYDILAKDPDLSGREPSDVYRGELEMIKGYLGAAVGHANSLNLQYEQKHRGSPRTTLRDKLGLVLVLLGFSYLGLYSFQLNQTTGMISLSSGQGPVILGVVALTIALCLGIYWVLFRRKRK